MKRMLGYAASVLILLTMTGEAWAMARQPANPVLVVIPDRYATVQLGMDLIAQREVVLVSYKGGSADQPVLHAWNGREWVYVNLQDYRDAAFLKVLPSEAILVGDEETLPRVLLEATDWCSRIWEVPSTQTSDLVNAFGRVFSFNSREWLWYSQRYNLDVDSDKQRDSWYFHPYVTAPAAGGAPVAVPPAAPGDTPERKAPVDEPPPVPVEQSMEPKTVEPPPAVEPRPTPVAPALSVPVPGEAEMEGWTEEAVAN